MGLADDYRLRIARKADGAAVHALLWGCRDDIPLHESFQERDSVDWVGRECSARRVWLIEAKGAVVAAMVMRGAEIFYLAVSESHRRRGLAAALVAQAKMYCRNRGWEGLNARSRRGNSRIAALLTKEGFRPNWAADDPQEGWRYWSWDRPLRASDRSRVGETR